MVEINDERGSTLIELMITLLLVGLVVTGGIRLYLFADRALVKGSEEADLQAAMHRAMHRITEEVRLAHRLAIAESKDCFDDDGQPEDQLHPHFIYVENGSVYLDGRCWLDGNVLNASYRLHFEAVYGQDVGQTTDLLRISLLSQSPERKYSLDSQVQVLNLRVGGIQGDEHGSAIKFTTTFSPEEIEAVETVNPRCVYLQMVYGSNSPKLYALRRFRDEQLNRTPLGQLVVQAYYAISPRIIAFTELHPWVGAPVKTVLRGAAELVLLFT